MTGCKALEGCEKKAHCLRYHLHLQSTPYVGWSSYQQCRISEFTEKTYPFLVKLEGH